MLHTLCESSHRALHEHEQPGSLDFCMFSTMCAWLVCISNNFARNECTQIMFSWHTHTEQQYKITAQLCAGLFRAGVVPSCDLWVTLVSTLVEYNLRDTHAKPLWYSRHIMSLAVDDIIMSQELQRIGFSWRFFFLDQFRTAGMFAVCTWRLYSSMYTIYLYFIPGICPFPANHTTNNNMLPICWLCGIRWK